MAYLIVCIDRGYMLPGVPSMLAQILDHRDAYIDALRAVDASVKDEPDALDLAPISRFLRKMLVRQLATVVADLDAPLKPPLGD